MRNHLNGYVTLLMWVTYSLSNNRSLVYDFGLLWDVEGTKQEKKKECERKRQKNKEGEEKGR